MYNFFSEFKEVCIMIKLQNLSQGVIKLCFIHFPLKIIQRSDYIAYPLILPFLEESMTLFLKKYFPIHKMAKIRMAINQFCLAENFFESI